MNKTAHDAGADNRTPSIAQYFSWINNTNEGSTEEHTLINLDFFKYLKDTYGMQIKIYAWDAGNFDGASEGYGNLDGEKFKVYQRLFFGRTFVCVVYPRKILRNGWGSVIRTCFVSCLVHM